MTARNPSLLAVTGPLKDAGVPYTIIHGKHLKVQWLASGERRCVIASRTASDYRADRNNRALVLRILRQDGVLV